MTEAGRTNFRHGIEYNAYPPPREVLKLTKQAWAEQMVKTGTLWFGNLAWYRDWENEILGDPSEGEGVLCVDGRAYTIESAAPVFAWCASLASVELQHMQIMAKQQEYDCVVRVFDVQELSRRLSRALRARNLWLHCGQVSYNKREEVSLEVVNSQQFHFNVFQKDGRFAADHEYRLALTDFTMRHAIFDHITVDIGACADIMKVEALSSL